MDDFLSTYLIVLVLSVLGFVLFWGVIIYLVIKFLRGDTGLSSQQKLGILTQSVRMYSGGRGPSEPGPVESSVRGMAASEGINLDR